MKRFFNRNYQLALAKVLTPSPRLSREFHHQQQQQQDHGGGSSSTTSSSMNDKYGPTPPPHRAGGDVAEAHRGVDSAIALIRKREQAVAVAGALVAYVNVRVHQRMTHEHAMSVAPCPKDSLNYFRRQEALQMSDLERAERYLKWAERDLKWAEDDFERAKRSLEWEKETDERQTIMRRLAAVETWSASERWLPFMGRHDFASSLVREIDIFTSRNSPMDKSRALVLSGPPGCGKTRALFEVENIVNQRFDAKKCLAIYIGFDCSMRLTPHERIEGTRAEIVVLRRLYMMLHLRKLGKSVTDLPTEESLQEALYYPPSMPGSTSERTLWRELETGCEQMLVDLQVEVLFVLVDEVQLLGEGKQDGYDPVFSGLSVVRCLRDLQGSHVKRARIMPLVAGNVLGLPERPNRGEHQNLQGTLYYNDCTFMSPQDYYALAKAILTAPLNSIYKGDTQTASLRILQAAAALWPNVRALETFDNDRFLDTVKVGKKDATMDDADTKLWRVIFQASLAELFIERSLDAASRLHFQVKGGITDFVIQVVPTFNEYDRILPFLQSVGMPDDLIDALPRPDRDSDARALGSSFDVFPLLAARIFLCLKLDVSPESILPENPAVPLNILWDDMYRALRLERFSPDVPFRIISAPDCAPNEMKRYPWQPNKKRKLSLHKHFIQIVREKGNFVLHAQGNEREVEVDYICRFELETERSLWLFGVRANGGARRCLELDDAGHVRDAANRILRALGVKKNAFVVPFVLASHQQLKEEPRPVVDAAKAESTSCVPGVTMLETQMVRQRDLLLPWSIVLGMSDDNDVSSTSHDDDNNGSD